MRARQKKRHFNAHSTAVMWLGLVLICAIPAAPAAAQTYFSHRCFAETRQCVSGPRRELWEQVGGAAILGFPISTHIFAYRVEDVFEFPNQLSGVQWFEKVRLDSTPGERLYGPDGITVHVAPLGITRLRQLGLDWRTFAHADSSVAYYFPQTGHAIDPVFQPFWSAHGIELDGDPGISTEESQALFGQPISAAQLARAPDGAVVLTQWFERTRLEFRPERPDGEQIVIANLGVEVYSETWKDASRQVLDRVNFYRHAAGLNPVAVNPAVTTAAQRHADYFLVFNLNNPPAWNAGVHGEVSGQPGFSGVTATDRVKAAGYQGSGSEVISGGDHEPATVVDGLIAAPFHRLWLLNPQLTDIGFGRGSGYRDVDYVVRDDDPTQMRLKGMPDMGVIELGFAGSALAPRPNAVVFPGDAQQDVPVQWGGLEGPDDPRPNGAPRPNGYPISVQTDSGKLRVDLAELKDASGGLVATYPNPPGCPPRNCLIMIPAEPLQQRSTYVVHVRGAIDEERLDRTWSFTTGSLPSPPPR